MRRVYLGMLLAISAGAVFAKGPCADDVCKGFYDAVSITHFRTSMESVIVGEKAYQGSEGGKDVRKAAEIYVDGMNEVVKQAKEKVMPEYQASLKSSKGNREVQAALKDMYAKWLAGITYFVKYPLERGEKEVRFRNDQKAVDDAWAKVQAEAGI